MVEYVILVLVFALIAGLTYWGYLLLSRPKKRVEQRLESIPSSDPSIGSTPELILGDMTPALAGAVPMGAEDKTELQRELRTAGYYRPSAVTEYAALRAVLIIVPLIAAGVLALFTETTKEAAWIWGGGILLAVLGFSVPRVFLYYRGRARMHTIERGLPTAIDMLTLCLGAGLNVLNSLQRVTQELHAAFPVLAGELEIVRRQAELRTLEFALAQFADRVGLPQVRNISVILSQSENLGTDAVSVLREYADNLRVNMRQRADEMANRAPLLLLVPAYMMAAGAAILLISPVVLEFNSFRKSNMIGNSILQARDVLKDNTQKDRQPSAPSP